MIDLVEVIFKRFEGERISVKKRTTTMISQVDNTASVHVSKTDVCKDFDKFL